MKNLRVYFRQMFLTRLIWVFEHDAHIPENIPDMNLSGVAEGTDFIASLLLAPANGESIDEQPIGSTCLPRVFTKPNTFTPYIVACVKEGDVVAQPTSGLRAKLARSGGSCKVRKMFHIILNFMPLEERIITEERLKKRSRCKPRRNHPKTLKIANDSLSDSDFINNKRIIL
ncbi:hypothetical protein V6N12_074367 [Hibiscus sabdariffa]|uniref:Uncharacterized protein n=1 Tax=Hibiscus sabdariffa TaxID=183260 RepID=A0ABR2BMQ5_9ROSI